MDIRWASYFEQFNFVIRHKSGVDNKVPDALSRMVQLLVTLQSEIIGFDFLKELYEKDEDFEEIWESVRQGNPWKTAILWTISFQRKSACVLRTSLREVIRDFYMGAGLEGTLEETRRWLVMKRDIIVATGKGCGYHCEELSSLPSF